ncbi:MAG: Maf family protein [Vicinamibacterales bacterium]
MTLASGGSKVATSVEGACRFTAVVVDGDILGKPRDDDHAAEMLRRLSGRRHDVLTGVSLRAHATRGVRLPWPERGRRQSDLEREVGSVERTTVEFSSLTEAEVAAYVASGEGRDKAGAYAIQGRASRFIPRIEGSYSSVVGLPVAAVQALLVQIASAGHSGYSQR